MKLTKKELEIVKAVPNEWDAKISVVNQIFNLRARRALLFYEFVAGAVISVASGVFVLLLEGRSLLVSVIITVLIVFLAFHEFYGNKLEKIRIYYEDEIEELVARRSSWQVKRRK